MMVTIVELILTNFEVLLAMCFEAVAVKHYFGFPCRKIFGIFLRKTCLCFL